jgi:hypothetical protein
MHLLVPCCVYFQRKLVFKCNLFRKIFIPIPVIKFSLFCSAARLSKFFEFISLLPGNTSNRRSTFNNLRRTRKRFLLIFLNKNYINKLNGLPVVLQDFSVSLQCVVNCCRLCSRIIARDVKQNLKINFFAFS